MNKIKTDLQQISTFKNVITCI